MAQSYIDDKVQKNVWPARGKMILGLDAGSTAMFSRGHSGRVVLSG